MRYYFVTDKIKNGEVKVAYCPMENMLGEFFPTNLYRNSAFRNMQDNFNFIRLGYITYNCAFPFGSCESEARAVLKKKGKTKPTAEKL